MIRDDDEREGWTRPALLIGAGGAVLAILLGMLAPLGGGGGPLLLRGLDGGAVGGLDDVGLFAAVVDGRGL